MVIFNLTKFAPFINYSVKHNNCFIPRTLSKVLFYYPIELVGDNMGKMMIANKIEIRFQRYYK